MTLKNKRGIFSFAALVLGFSLFSAQAQTQYSNQPLPVSPTAPSDDMTPPALTDDWQDPMLARPSMTEDAQKLMEKFKNQVRSGQLSPEALKALQNSGGSQGLTNSPGIPNEPGMQMSSPMAAPMPNTMNPNLPLSPGAQNQSQTGTNIAAPGQLNYPFQKPTRLQEEKRALDQDLLSNPRSSIESLFFGKFPNLISRQLKQFGYDLFSKSVPNFMPLDSVPTNPDYLVGPGDSFTINVWGAQNFTYRVTVNREGNIYLPKIGTIRAWGQSYKDLQKTIEKRVSGYFSGVKVNVLQDNIRLLNVFIVGEVKQPGSYSVPSTSSAINALFSAGGPSKNGSLRDVRIVRDGKEIAKVDLYDFLISGANSKQQLQSQDVILVPVVGKVIAIAGNVKRPAIYEIKDKTNLFDVLQMAGGLSFTGHVGRLSLERIQNNKERITKDFELPEDYRTITRELAAKTDLGTPVEDGDLIQIFPVLAQFRQTINLRGYVKRPGSYEFKQGMTLHSLLNSYDQLQPDPYVDFVQIIRTNPPRDSKTSLFANLQRVIEGDSSADIALQERDEIIVFSKEELDLREKVIIEGKVNRPGAYFYFDGMTLKDLIFMAGNLTQDAYLANAELARYTVTNQELKFDRMQLDLRLVMDGNTNSNLVLQPKDRVYVHGMPNWELENFITVSGEVRFPGSYSFNPKERLSSIVERAGGFTDKAFLPGAVFTRETVKGIQQKSLKEQISKLEEAVLDQGVQAKTDTPEDAQALQESMAARRDMLKRLQESEVSGRMVIEIKELNKFKNGRYDITLEPGDTLTIPPIPSVVTIMGEVFNPTSVVYVDGKTVQQYIDQSGGVTMNADKDSIFVVKADGTVISRRQNRGFLLRNFYQMKVDRGDTILIPKDISRFSWLATTKDLTEILFKIASTTGITIQAFK